MIVKNSIKRDKNGEVGSDKVTKAKKVEKKVLTKREECSKINKSSVEDGQAKEKL